MKVVFYFFQGLPAAFASYLAPEQFRGGGCAHGSLRSPRQSCEPCYVFRDQPAGVPKVSGTMVDLWYVSSSHAKKGLWGALVTPRLHSGSWDSLGRGSPNSCLEYEASSSYDQEICPSFFQFLYCFWVICRGTGLSLLLSVVKAFSSSLGSTWVLIECCWMKHAGVVTDPLLNTKLSGVRRVKATACIYCPAAARL